MTEIDYENLLLQRGSELALDLFTLEGTFKAATAAVTDSYATFNSRVKQAYEQAQNIRIGVQRQFGILDEENGRMLAKKIADQQQFLKQNEITVAKFASNFNEVGKALSTYVIKRSDDAIISFAKLVSINDKFGISTTNTTDLINKLGGGFGMNAEQIDKFSGKLLTFAKETGQDFNKVFTDFNKSMQSFYTILDPEKAGTQFMSFQQMARGFGTTIESLMQTAAKFDDIQQGVDFGANLNNVLSAVGGSFDAVLASTMDYDSRIKYIMKSIADTRGNIDQMSDVSQRAFIRQLQQSSGLNEQTLVSLLRNKDLVDNIENMTKGEGEFKDLKEIPKTAQEEMARGFTTFQERADLFLNVWTQFGTRAEKLFATQSEYMRDFQFFLLGPLSKASKEARNLGDIQKIVKNTIGSAADVIQESIQRGALPPEIQQQRQMLQDEYQQAITRGLAPPTKEYLPPVKRAGAAGTTIELGEGLKVRHIEALEKLASEMESKRTNPPQEYKTSITVYGDETLLAVVKEFSQGGTRQRIIPGTAPGAGP